MELLRQTWSNLAANKLRSFLTMFGIMWGVISIVLLSAVGEGFQRGNQHVLEELGKNIVIIRNGRTADAGRRRAGRAAHPLDIEDVRLLQEQSKLLADVSPELMRGGIRAKSAFNSSSLQLSGVWPAYQSMRTIEVDRGRLITEADCREARRVVVIGTEASRQLFAERDPVGIHDQPERAAVHGDRARAEEGPGFQLHRAPTTSGCSSRTRRPARTSRCRATRTRPTRSRPSSRRRAPRWPGSSRRGSSARASAASSASRRRGRSRWTSGRRSRRAHGFDPRDPGGALDVEHGDRGGDVREDDRRDAHVLRRG